MKIYLLAPIEDWICDRFVSEFKQLYPDLVEENPAKADIVWLLADWCWTRIPESILKTKIVINTVHHIVPEKFDMRAMQEFAYRDQFVDQYHVPCIKTKEQVSRLTSKKIWSQPFWVNQNLWFKEKQAKADIRNVFGFPQDKFLVGSFQRDTEGKDLVSPKLEKGPDRFCDAVISLQKERGDVEVVLAAWRRQYVMKRLNEAGIKFHYFELPTFQVMNKLYNSLDLYIVGSRYEGGPQSILECALAEVPIVSCDVGVAAEILHKNSILTNISELKSFNIPTQDEILHAKKTVSSLHMPQGSDIFVKFFESVLNDKS